MATIWIGGAPSIKQVNSETPANVEVGDIFMITLSDDLENSYQISYTATAATVENVVDGLHVLGVAAKTAGYKPWDDVTCTEDNAKVTITADTAGKPFYVETDITNGGAADTQTLTDLCTTANVGPHDLATGLNYPGGVAPEEGDELKISATAEDDILYGLKYLTANTIHLISFDKEEGCTIAIGNNRQSLEILLTGENASEVRLAGTGQCFLYLEGGFDPIYITESGADSGGACGTNIEAKTDVDYDVYVNLGSGQSVGLAAVAGQAMQVNNVKVEGGARVILGRGVTGDPVIEALGVGELETYCQVGNLITEMTWIHYEGDFAAAGTTIKLNAGSQTVLLSDAITQGAVSLADQAVLTAGPSCGTPTSLNIYGSGWVVNDEFGKLPAHKLNDCNHQSGQYNGPKDKTWTAS